MFVQSLTSAVGFCKVFILSSSAIASSLLTMKVLGINRQESCTTKDNANAHLSSKQSLSWDIYSFLEKASCMGDTSNTGRGEWRRVIMRLSEIAWPFEGMQKAIFVL